MKQIGYGEYSTNLLENNIDGRTLLDFTKQDFTDLYIHSVGHRKAIERHINELRKEANYVRGEGTGGGGEPGHSAQASSFGGGVRSNANAAPQSFPRGHGHSRTQPNPAGFGRNGSSFGGSPYGGSNTVQFLFWFYSQHATQFHNWGETARTALPSSCFAFLVMSTMLRRGLWRVWNRSDRVTMCCTSCCFAPVHSILIFCAHI